MLLLLMRTDCYWLWICRIVIRDNIRVPAAATAN
jgi:hypothetical protein